MTPASLCAFRVVPTQCLLTVDGQTGFELRVGDEVRCQRSAYTVNLIRLSESGFF